MENHFRGKYQKFRKSPNTEGGYPVPILRQYLSELKFADRKTTLQREQQNRAKKTATFCCKKLYLD